jgi:hypothetical protein
VIVTRHQRLPCQLPFAMEDAYVDAAGRPLSPHQCGRLNNQGRIVTEQQAEMMQLSSEVRPRLLLSRVGPEGGG